MSTIKINEYERNKLNKFQGNSNNNFDFNNYEIENIIDSVNYMNGIEKNIYCKIKDTFSEHTTKINELENSIKRRDNYINKCCLLMAACAIVNTILSAIKFVGA